MLFFSPFPEYQFIAGVEYFIRKIPDQVPKHEVPENRHCDWYNEEPCLGLTTDSREDHYENKEPQESKPDCRKCFLIPESAS